MSKGVGESSELGELYSAHYSELRDFAATLVLEEDQVDELINTAMLYALSNRAPHRLSTIRSYMASAASRTRWFMNGGIQAEPYQEIPCGCRPPDESLHRKDILRRIAVGLKSLEPHEKAVLRGFAIENKAIVQLAREFGTSERSIRRSYQSALDKLGQKFDQEDLRGTLALPVMALVKFPKARSAKFIAGVAGCVAAAFLTVGIVRGAEAKSDNAEELVAAPGEVRDDDLDSTEIALQVDARTTALGVESPSEPEDKGPKAVEALRTAAAIEKIAAMPKIHPNLQGSGATGEWDWRSEVFHPDAKWVTLRNLDGSIRRRFQEVPYLDADKRAWGESWFFDGKGNVVQLAHMRNGEFHGPRFSFHNGELVLFEFYRSGKKEE